MFNNDVVVTERWLDHLIALSNLRTDDTTEGRTERAEMPNTGTSTAENTEIQNDRTFSTPKNAKSAKENADKQGTAEGFVAEDATIGADVAESGPAIEKSRSAREHHSTSFRVAVLLCCSAIIAVGFLLRLVIWTEDKRVAVAQVPQLSESACRHALLGLLRRIEESPDYPQLKHSRILVAGDVDFIYSGLKTSADGFERAATHVFSGIPYVDGWRCDPRVPGFSKLFLCNGVRRYRLKGRFQRSTEGEWQAELTALTRLMTRSEVAETAHSKKDMVKEIELIPSPEEMKRTLLAWVRRGNHEYEFTMMVRATEGLRAYVLRDLESTETLDELAHAKIEVENFGYRIDGFYVFLEDLRFQKGIAAADVFLPHMLEGLVEWKNGTEWTVTPKYLAPTMK